MERRKSIPYEVLQRRVEASRMDTITETVQGYSYSCNICGESRPERLGLWECSDCSARRYYCIHCKVDEDDGNECLRSVSEGQRPREVSNSE